MKNDAKERFLANAEKLCAEQKERLTSLRRKILAILLKTGGPVKAYDLVEALRSEPGRGVTAATVYRILDFLLGRGLVHKVNALNAFVVCNAPWSGHDPLMLICPDCQKTVEINDAPLSAALFERLEQLGFPLNGGSVEIHGVCRECRTGPPENFMPLT